MFTGLVENVGEIVALEALDTGFALRVRADGLSVPLEQGASIAVDGVCLTALEPAPGSFRADISPETIQRTNMREYEVGSLVNLEHPLRAGAPLGGHFVQGHVDAVCEVTGVIVEDDFVRMEVSVPEAQRPFLVEKGSVAVNGVSLTVAALTPDGFVVQLVPHTLTRTNLLSERRAKRLNLEVDILGKYVAQLLAPHLAIRDQERAAGRTR